jgi:hypothetical protein
MSMNNKLGVCAEYFLCNALPYLVSPDVGHWTVFRTLPLSADVSHWTVIAMLHSFGDLLIQIRVVAVPGLFANIDLK